MIKLLIVVFSFFCIVGEGYTTETTVFNKDGNSIGTRDSSGKFTSDGSSEGNVKALSETQKNSGMYADQNKANQSQAEDQTQTDTTTPKIEGGEDIPEEITITAEKPKTEEKTKSINECDKNPELCSTNNILGLQTRDLRTGNVNQNTIATVIVNIINLLLGVAGTVAIFSLIYHAVQMQINSGITGDSSGVDKAKKGMIGALIGFVIAISAWFLVARVVELLGAAS